MTGKSAVKHFGCSSAVLVFALAMGAGSARASSTLQGLWHFDSVHDLKTPDDSGNDNTAAICIDRERRGTCAEFTSGKFVHALRFDGKDDAVVIPDSGSLEITGDLTVEAWIWIDPAAKADQTMTIAAKRNGPYGRGGYYLTALGGEFLVGSLGSSSCYYVWGGGYAPLSSGQWHHVALVFRTSDPIFSGHPSGGIYADGVLQFSVDTKGCVDSLGPAPGVPVTIGAMNNPRSGKYIQFFDGKIDEVRIWSRALTDNEILASAQSGLRGDWHLDASAKVVTPDSSGYANHAILKRGARIGGSGPEPWFGDALQLGAGNSSAYASVPDTFAVEPLLSFTLEGWIKPSSVSGSQTIAGRWTPGNDSTSAYLLQLMDNQLYGAVALGAGGEVDVEGGAITPGTWQHVALVLDTSAGTMTLYVNGVSVSSTSSSSLTPPAPSFGYLPTVVNPVTGINLTIGAASNGTNFFSGGIDELHLWGRALSAEEITFLHNSKTRAELTVPYNITQKIETNDVEVFPETYFPFAPIPEGPPERAMPLWFMVSDPDSTKTFDSSLPHSIGCAIDLGSIPWAPLFGGLLGCQGSADGKSALLSGKQIPVNGGHPFAKALHTEVTLDDSDRLPVIFQWLP